MENLLGYNMSDIEDRLKKIMAKSFNIPLASIKDDSDLINDLGADSLGVFEMVINIEDEFGVEFNDKELMKFTTVKEAITNLAPLLSKD